MANKPGITWRGLLNSIGQMSSAELDQVVQIRDYVNEENLLAVDVVPVAIDDNKIKEFQIGALRPE